jgi:hypothetical protein
MIPVHQTLAGKQIAVFTKLVTEIGSFKTGVLWPGLLEGEAKKTSLFTKLVTEIVLPSTAGWEGTPSQRRGYRGEPLCSQNL